MNVFYKIHCRFVQKAFYLGSLIIPFRKPKLIEGNDFGADVVNILTAHDITNCLVLTTNGMHKRGTIDKLKNDLINKNINFEIYDKTVPNPTIENVEEALALFKQNNSQAIVAIGGGSVMDCAKIVGARVARPHKKISQFKGLMKVIHKIPLLITVPSTAGSGSETTIASVISDPSHNTKYAISDPALIPHYAIMDPTLTVGLPKNMTATTGMDALTHAIEAYIGKSNTPSTRKNAKIAVKLIMDNLMRVCDVPDDLNARENMQKGAYFAGLAFTKAYVGYVHAIAHALGGMYNVAHGLANAVILPKVLRKFGSSIYKKLAELADWSGIGQKFNLVVEKANAFIDKIELMNASMGIPKNIEGIMEKDIDALALHAYKEANPLYPVPKIWSINDIKQIIKEVM